MIVGVGVDIVEVERIRRALEDGKIGQRFRDRVYTKGEIEYCEDKRKGKYQSYAGRFAAKEAVMKALGSGWGSRVTWQEIEVLPALGGRPEVSLKDKTAAYARDLGMQNFLISISHSERFAVAYVVAQTP